MKPVFGLVGAGGFAREVMPLIQHSHIKELYEEIFFVESNPKATEVNGIRVLSENAFLKLEKEKSFNVAIGDSKTRNEICERLINCGAELVSIHADNSTFYNNNDIGIGSIFCANTTVTSNVKVGKGFHANIYSYVAHDCVIGDYVTFAPRVHCNGNVHIHDHAYVGTGAIIRQGTLDKPLTIGQGAIIGMGAVVTKSVPAGVTVIGNPARDINSRLPG